MSTSKHEYDPNAASTSSNERSSLLQQGPTIHYDAINAITQEDPPLYIEIDTNLRDRVAQLAAEASSDAHPLPIQSYPFPEPYPWQRISTDPNVDPIHRKRQEIVTAYFEAIKSKKDEVIAAFIESGLVGPETRNADGRTPLLAAIEAGHVRTVQQLMDFDADVNAFGVVSGMPPRHYYAREEPVEIFRTPLMLAAETGNLTIVKLLMETYAADDALVAPDGELALRLAASKGHREVVLYLPTRRRGGWRRWKTKHRKAVKRCVRAVHGIYAFFEILLFEVPKFFLWSVPKHCVVRPVVRGVKWLGVHYKELPGRIWKGVKIMGKRLKRVPKHVWEVIKGLAEFVWIGIKRSPRAMKIALVWAWTGVERFGYAIANVVLRFFAFLHTVFAAVVDFFRNITLKDVWDGFKTFLHALFVDGPKKIWEWMCAFEKVTLKMFEALWGCSGWLLWMLLRGIVGVFVYVPKKVLEILVSMGGSLGNAFREVLIWIDPKRR